MEGTMVSLPNRFKIHLAIVFAVFLGFAFTPLPGYSAEVDVYAEGAYSSTNLVLYIYADIDPGPILSFGVKVNYPPSLTFVSATKNEAVWYFGDATTKYPYMNPEISPEGGVVIIGGKLDTGAPEAGVDGARVLLGTVTFTHAGVTDFSSVDLTYAHGDGTGTFSNFVGTNGVVKDVSNVDFIGATIAERGDANADGFINSTDAQWVSQIFFGRRPWSILADCNGDGSVNSTDAQCISQRFFNP
jgi:hypothetical protein